MACTPDSTDDQASIKVIGAGVMRTGTFSLRLALEHLLGGKCYHMHYVKGNPERIQFWTNAVTKTPSDDEFRQHLQDFRAAVDFPCCAFYNNLADLYPDAKVILTVRDRHDWIQSLQKTIFSLMQKIEALPDGAPEKKFANMSNSVVSLIFGKTVYSEDEEMIKLFDQHVENVKKNIPPDRLLVFEVKDGWKPLCEFLNVPIPDEPFPKTNTTDDFHQNKFRFNV